MLPLINVVFLLMVFFMLVGALAPPEALPVRPARAATLDPADASSGSLVVAADGRLGLAGEVFASDQLAARVAAWRAQQPHAVLQVKADAGAEAQGVLDVLEALRAAGVPRVELMAAPAAAGDGP